MKTVKFLLILSVCFLLQESIYAQGKNRKLQKADAYFSTEEYFNASEKYRKAYPRIRNKTLKGEVAFKLGECFRILNIPKKAEAWYKKAISNKYPDTKVILYYADAIKMQQRWDEAITKYKEYKKIVPSDLAGEIGVKSCEQAKEWLSKPSRYTVEEMKDFNSKQSDFCAAYSRSNFKELYFTSNREAANGEKNSGVTGLNGSDIFVIRQDNKGNWSEPVPIEGDVNTMSDEGCPTFNKNKISMYFNRCNWEKGNLTGCKIYNAEKNEGKWGNVQEVKLQIDSSANIFSPTISADELTMYFVSSDLKDGYGGKDIWVVTRPSKDNEWGTPVNLGTTINSPGDERFPYLRNDTMLYFSSNYWAGMGGLDIFCATKHTNNKWTIENLQYPVNSSSDDFGMLWETENEQGYINSSRNGNDDFFSFKLPSIEFSMKGIVVDEKTGKYIPEAKIKMLDDRGEALENVSAKDGTFSFKLKAKTDYLLTTSKDGFFNGKGQETTRGYTESKTFNMRITMMPIDTLIELPNIEYDYGDDKLRPISMVSLDKLVETLNDNPGIIIELQANTDFRGDTASNRDLSQRRAQSVVNYLVKQGIDMERLKPKGNGENIPKVVNGEIVKSYTFLKVGDILDENFITRLTDKNQIEICHQLNRRTEFRVLSNKYQKR